MKVSSGLIQDEISLPSSKSVANRLLILAALSNNKISISNIPASDDVQNLILCLKTIGLDIIQDDKKVIIKNSFPECEVESQVLEVGEGGTTLHFLMGLLSLGTKKYQLKIAPTLSSRPHEDFINALRLLGVECNHEENIMTIKGPVCHKSITIDCSKSSQYASSLALIKNKARINIHLKDLDHSESFYSLTLNTIKNFKEENTVPIDMASLSYPAMFSLLNQSITINNIDELDYQQPDAEIYKLFKDSFICEKSKLKIYPLKNKKAICINMKNSLDMIPSMAFLASYLEGESQLIGIKNLIYKESDRLKWTQYLLDSFEVEYKVENDSLFIMGRKPITKVKKLKLPNDHRIVMTAYLYLKQNGGGELDNTQAITKSFPSFFDELEK